jgi:hypothetical protein
MLPFINIASQRMINQTVQDNFYRGLIGHGARCIRQSSVSISGPPHDARALLRSLSGSGEQLGARAVRLIFPSRTSTVSFRQHELQSHTYRTTRERCIPSGSGCGSTSTSLANTLPSRRLWNDTPQSGLAHLLTTSNLLHKPTGTTAHLVPHALGRLLTPRLWSQRLSWP